MEKNIPRRRFKEFVGSGDWEEKKIRDIFRITRGNVLATTMTSKQKSDYYCYPVYSSQTLNNGLMGYYNDYLYKDSITWTTDGANAGTVKYRSGKFYCTNVCGVLLSNEGYSNKMVAEVLNKIAWQYVSKVGNPKLMNNIMGEIIIKLPSLGEQEKIGNFFQKLDRLIEVNREKLDKLKASKSAYLTEMFPREGEDRPRRRFKGFTGAWEEKKLGEVASYTNGKAHEQNISNDGKYIVVNSKFISTDGEVRKFTDVQIEPLFKDEITFVLSDVPNGRAIARTFLIDANDKYTLNQRIARISPFKDVNPYFLYIIMNRNEYFLKFDDGVKQTNLSVDDVLSFNAFYPSLAEQEKIGDFFKKLDDQIGLQEEKLEKLEKMKKAYLAEMFV